VTSGTPNAGVLTSGTACPVSVGWSSQAHFSRSSLAHIFRNTLGVVIAVGAVVLLFAAGLAAIGWATAPPSVQVMAGRFSPDRSADFASNGVRIAPQRLVSTPSTGGEADPRRPGSTSP
jgi:hypothetical protein